MEMQFIICYMIYDLLQEKIDEMNSKDSETKGTHVVNKLGCQWGCTMSSGSFQLLTRLSSTFLRIKSV